MHFQRCARQARHPDFALMFAQVMQLAGRNEDWLPTNKYPARGHSLHTPPFHLRPPSLLPPSYCIAAQRTDDHSNVMAFRNLLQSSFMQSILTFLPSVRHAIEQPSPSRVDAAPRTPPQRTLSASTTTTAVAAVAVEPYKEEADRWRQAADKTAAERDQLKEEAGRLHGEMQRLVADLGQVRVEAEEMWRTQESALRRESEEAVLAAEERVRREANESTLR